jgi:hypothetical protein
MLNAESDKRQRTKHRRVNKEEKTLSTRRCSASAFSIGNISIRVKNSVIGQSDSSVPLISQILGAIDVNRYDRLEKNGRFQNFPSTAVTERLQWWTIGDDPRTAIPLWIAPSSSITTCICVLVAALFHWATPRSSTHLLAGGWMRRWFVDDGPTT